MEALVHLAAQNPYPDAPWTDACASFDMTLNMLAASAGATVRRVVFASSNHVMGQYKDATLANGLCSSRPFDISARGSGNALVRWP